MISFVCRSPLSYVILLGMTLFFFVSSNSLIEEDEGTDVLQERRNQVSAFCALGRVSYYVYVNQKWKVYTTRYGQAFISEGRSPYSGYNIARTAYNGKWQRAYFPSAKWRRCSLENGAHTKCARSEGICVDTRTSICGNDNTRFVSRQCRGSNAIKCCAVGRPQIHRIEPMEPAQMAVQVPRVTNLANIVLPKTYSHTRALGYNLLSSQWIGSLQKSALVHVGTPTYDVPGTNKGSLGCAAAVSIMFYRAFGISMKTGSQIKQAPSRIDDFGTLSTSVMSKYLRNTNLFRERASWRQAQPGDIVNTPRGHRAGHVGIVAGGTCKNGSLCIISNSSRGFRGGGGGAIKKNYSIKNWESVAARNPGKTKAYYYVGAKGKRELKNYFD